MSTTALMTIVAIVVLLLILVPIVYFYFKNRSLEKIRGDVYQLFIKAEHNFTETESGKQKMKWVVQRARSFLPKWLQLIITDETLEKIIQMWFDLVKDLLDDGKYNGSVKEE